MNDREFLEEVADRLEAYGLTPKGWPGRLREIATSTPEKASSLASENADLRIRLRQCEQAAIGYHSRLETLEDGIIYMSECVRRELDDRT